MVWAQVSTLPLLSKDLDPRFDIASAASWTALRREIATYRSKASTLQAGESAGQTEAVSEDVDDCLTFGATKLPESPRLISDRLSVRVRRSGND